MVRVDTCLQLCDDDRDPCSSAVLLGHVLVQLAMSHAVRFK